MTARMPLNYLGAFLRAESLIEECVSRSRRDQMYVASDIVTYNIKKGQKAKSALESRFKDFDPNVIGYHGTHIIL